MIINSAYKPVIFGSQQETDQVKNLLNSVEKKIGQGVENQERISINAKRGLDLMREEVPSGDLAGYITQKTDPGLQEGLTEREVLFALEAVGNPQRKVSGYSRDDKDIFVRTLRYLKTGEMDRMIQPHYDNKKFLYLG